MTDTVKITIDETEYEVPAGMNMVDAAKWHANNDIPVFCYHPKMEPVGMCRMCLVEMGTIQKDRTTGEVLVDDKGNPQVRWFPKLQTACTTPASDGLVIRTNTKWVEDDRRNVLEFLLTSHPLDCPICDKGGECPLQNLTMAHGPGTTRMNYSDKMHLDKNVPLGDLIILDQERCIQCARCIRFQDEVVGDDVLAFHERGRTLQIITNSEPGFDTYFSGNTTDICPVGALTTVDFRFGARPWELNEVPSICPHDPAGSNISLSMRLDRDAGGKSVIKRVMPRQNEAVNEIWISDKTRFGHHFTRSENRLYQPMVRAGGGSLNPKPWNEALQAAADALKTADGNIGVIAGSGLSNEDLWTLRQLVNGLGSERLGAWPPTHGGLEFVAQVGVGKGTNLGELGAGDAVLVIASDLEEEVPIWYLRVKQAQDRGAYLVVANARGTRLEEFAIETLRFNRVMQGDAIRYAPGDAAKTLANLSKDNAEIADRLAKANNLVIIAGAEGLTLDGSRALMEAAANLLIDTKHVGKANNGLISTAPGANATGQHYLGYTPEATQDIIANPPKVLIVAQADVMADDPNARNWLKGVDTVISLSLFNDDLGAVAKAVLPIQSFAERDGSFVNGERRVQRFYTAQGPVGEALPAWYIFSRLGEMVGKGRSKPSAAAVMLDITKNVPAFEGATFRELAQVTRQYPDVGGQDLYYGGTAYQNKGGLGVQIATAADAGDKPKKSKLQLPDTPKVSKGKFLVVPVTRLYNREKTFETSSLMHARIPAPYAQIHSDDAKKLGFLDGDYMEVAFEGGAVRVQIVINDEQAKGMVVLPRHLTTAATPYAPTEGDLKKASAPTGTKATTKASS